MILKEYIKQNHWPFKALIFDLEFQFPWRARGKAQEGMQSCNSTWSVNVTKKYWGKLLPKKYKNKHGYIIE